MVLLPAEELPHGTAWRPVEAFRKAAVDSGKCVDVPMRLTKYQLRKEAELQVRVPLAKCLAMLPIMTRLSLMIRYMTPVMLDFTICVTGFTAPGCAT
jgi:hypothetical protein